MDEVFLRYYNEELQYLREMGAEFAQSHPKVAGRLGMQDIAVNDPYVERLLEGFAFLTSRIRLKQDAQFPKFTNNLLESVFPNFLSPMPSMTIVQMKPDPAETSLAEGIVVPRHSSLFSLLGRGEQTRCEFRTAHDVQLWPLVIEQAEYLPTQAALTSAGIPVPQGVRAAVRLTLRTTGGQKISELAVNNLSLYLKGAEMIPGTLYEQLIGRSVAVAAKTSATQGTFSILSDSKVNQVGFDDTESLLPDDGRSFGGYRLLQEYFAFPQRYLFVELSDLAEAIRSCDSSSIEIVVLLSQSTDVLVEVLSADNFGLFCTPALNLFERRADRIQVTAQKLDHHVLADRTRPTDFEVWGITEAKGIADSSQESVELFPLYSSKDPVHGTGDCFFVTSREPRLLSSKQRRTGTRTSGYAGSEVYLSLVSPAGEPVFGRFKQVELQTLCTNRDLPMQGAWGQGVTDFDLQSGAPVLSIRCIDKPTPPRRSHIEGETHWRLINLLSANYLSIVGASKGAESLREMLRVFCSQGDIGAVHQLDGIVSVDSRGLSARLPVAGPQSFGRGLELSITLDETAFETANAFLFSAVLERFFGRFVTVNSFTRTRVFSKQRSEIMQWPIRAGHRDIL